MQGDATVHAARIEAALLWFFYVSMHNADTAEDLELRDRARAQLDAAVLKGLALIVRSGVQALDCAASSETVKTLGGVLDREATARNPDQAAVLRGEHTLRVSAKRRGNLP